MNDSRSAIDELLSEFRRELRSLGWRERRRALAEAHDHLLCSMEADSATSETAEEREKQAIRRFGDVASVAAHLRDARPRRRSKVGPTLVSAIAAAAFFAMPAGPISEELAPRVAAAASVPVQPNGVVAPRCAAAWNSRANARWHAYAKHLGAQRSYVGVAYMGRLENGKMVVSRRACTVKLWLTRKSGHWQSAVVIAGALQGNDVQFGTRAFPKSAKTPLRIRQRTTIQFANSHVRADGTLDYVGNSIP